MIDVVAKMKAAAEDKLKAIRSQEMKDAMRLARIDAHRHILEMVNLGCNGKELSDYLSACIRLECTRLPEGIVSA